MKTHEITLKKKILLVELPEGTKAKKKYYYEDDDETAIEVYSDDYLGCLLYFGSWEELGKLSDLQDSDVEDLVEKVMQGQQYQNYKARKENDAANLWCKSALESFMSALEAEVYWENPIPAPEGFKTENGWYVDDYWIRDYDEAESRTFDKSRTLIFINL